MKIDVTKERVAITQCHVVTEGEYCVNECEFQLPECFEGLTVTAVFNNIPVPLLNNRCFIPSLKKGGAVLGVYAYKKNGDELELAYSPKPTAFYVDEGSYNESTATEDVPEISRYEEYCKMLADFCENMILQMDYVKRDSLVQEITDESTHLQAASARAVYDVKKNFQSEVANALVGYASGEGVVIDDASPVSHNISCKLRRKNISEISDTGEFIKRLDVSFGETYPEGYYSVSGIVESDDVDTDKCLVWFLLNGIVKKGITLPKSNDGERTVSENIYISSSFNGIAFYSSENAYKSIDKKGRFSDLQIEAGPNATEYAPRIEYDEASVVAGGKNICSVEAVRCDSVDNDGQCCKKVGLGYTLPAGVYSFGAMITSTDTDSDKSMIVLLNEKDGETHEVSRLYFLRGNSERSVIENQKIDKPFNFVVFYPGESEDASVGDTVEFTELQIEFGGAATGFSKYESIREASSDASGKVELFGSSYPVTTILPSEKGLSVEVSYNRDINKVINSIEEKLLNKETE